MVVDVDGEDFYEVTTAPGELHTVVEAFQAMGVPVEEAQLTMQPKNTVQVAGNTAAAVLRLMEALEDNDDVQNVYANFDIPEGDMAAAMGA